MDDMKHIREKKYYKKNTIIVLFYIYSLKYHIIALFSNDGSPVFHPNEYKFDS